MTEETTRKQGPITERQMMILQILKEQPGNKIPMAGMDDELDRRMHELKQYRIDHR